MATLDVNDIVLTQSQEAASEVQGWGQLLPLQNDVVGFKLDKDEISFGRCDDVDYSFNDYGRNHKLINAVSKNHFILIRETSDSGLKFVRLKDLSSNGTYVNGILVGKNKSTILKTNDEIAVAKPTNKIFVFMDYEDLKKSYPAEVTDHYVIAKEIGKGAMGVVKLAFRKDSEKKLAVKIVTKSRFSSVGHTAVTQATQISREIAILKKINHPCIIHVEDVIDTPDTTYLMLELIEGGELFDLIVDSKKFPEDIAKLHAFQMVSAIQYLHSNHITHRDLKPENILVAKKGELRTLIKITDFGLSKFIDETSMMKTFCGTPNYLAPEILMSAGSGVYTKAVDLWSLGVIVFICLGGYPPFSKDYKDMDLRDQIIRGRYKFPIKFWTGVSEQAVDFIKQLLTVDHGHRMTAEDALNHEWLHDQEIRKEAHALMYPATNGFEPPSTTPRKRGLAELVPAGSVDMMETDDAPSKRAR